MKNKYYVKGPELWERTTPRANTRLFVETKSRTARKLANLLNLANQEDDAILSEMMCMGAMYAAESGFTSVSIDIDHLIKLIDIVLAAKAVTK
jgi:hypothetical protein